MSPLSPRLEALVFDAFLAAALATVVATPWWFRRHRGKPSALRLSVVLTTSVASPGVLLAGQVAFFALFEAWTGRQPYDPYSMAGVVLSFVWLLVAPPLCALSQYQRVRARPHGTRATTALQLVHLVTWILGTLVAFRIAISV